MSTRSGVPAIGVEGFREAGFFALLMVGMLVLALGVGFFIIGISINTAPPAPYVTPTDKWTLTGISVVGIIIGLVLVRAAGKVVGW